MIKRRPMPKSLNKGTLMKDKYVGFSLLSKTDETVVR